MCGSGIFVGGFLENMQGKIKVKDYMFLQGSKSKRLFLLLPSVRDGHGCAGASGHSSRRRRGRPRARLRCRTYRGELGDRREMLTGGGEGGDWISPNGGGRRPATQAPAAGCSEGTRRRGDGASDADQGHVAPGDGDFLRQSGGRPCLQTWRWSAALGSVVGRTRRQCRGKEGNIDWMGMTTKM
jgi:hypothetical protein